MAFVCGSDCAPLNWDFFARNLIWTAGLLIVFLVAGVFLSFLTATSNVEEFRDRLNLIKARLRNAHLYNVLVCGAALAQCILFTVRTYLKQVNEIDFLVEVIACGVYLTLFIPSWMHAQLIGLKTGVIFILAEAIQECLLLSSATCMALNQVGGRRSWTSLSFFGALHMLQAWKRILAIWQVNLAIMKWCLLDLLVSVIILTYFASMLILTLERLGDPGWGNGRPETLPWNMLTSVYFVATSISTVGFGDLAPRTGLGRTFAICAVIIGTYSVFRATHKVAQVLSLRSQGHGSWEPNLRSRHIVICGSATAQVVKEFISELFHQDHDEDAEDLHAIFLFPKGDKTLSEILEFLSLKSNIHLAAKVHALAGSVLDREGLIRVSAKQAAAFFLLPNTYCTDPRREDTENIIRVMAIQRAVPSARIVLLLMKSESEKLLNDAGLGAVGQAKGRDGSLTCLAFDKFKLELIGKTCQVPGFLTAISNLCTCVEVSGEDKESKRKELPAWQQEYESGLGNELYEVELSPVYASRNATFIEVVTDVLEQTGGFVYLIGLVESRIDCKRILVNPGPTYKIADASEHVQTSGIFIAPNREAVVQCEGGMVFLGRRERAGNEDDAVGQKKDKKKGSGENRPAFRKLAHQQSHLDSPVPVAEDVKARARNLVSLSEQHRRALQPSRGPIKMFARGQHVLLLCVGAKETEDLQFGVEHFVRALRRGVDEDEVRPIVVMAPVIPLDWHTITDYKEAYFIQGSPLSQFDLDRCNFKSAVAIFICQVSCSNGRIVESWTLDSEAICVSRMVESQLPPNAHTMVVVDLNSTRNHRFVPLWSLTSSGKLGGGPKPFSPQKSVIPTTSPKRMQSAYSEFGEVNSMKNDAGTYKEMPEFYRQPRFACGQLFVSTVMTSLAANTFYNPSLCDLVSTMISSPIRTVEVSREWVGKSFFELFDHILWTEQLLAIGIFRSVKGIRYLYTAPAGKETTMFSEDCVVCFAVAERQPRRANEAKR